MMNKEYTINDMVKLQDEVLQKQGYDQQARFARELGMLQGFANFAVTYYDDIKEIRNSIQRRCIELEEELAQA